MAVEVDREKIREAAQRLRRPDLRRTTLQLRADVIGSQFPGTATYLARLLDAEVSQVAGDEDHTPCTGDTCPIVAAMLLAEDLLEEG